MTIFVGKSARDMKDYLYLNHANDYAQSVGAETHHPMVNVVHFDELGPNTPQHFTRFFKKHAGLLPSNYIASLKMKEK